MLVLETRKKEEIAVCKNCITFPNVYHGKFENTRDFYGPDSVILGAWGTILKDLAFFSEKSLVFLGLRLFPFAF